MTINRLLEVIMEDFSQPTSYLVPAVCASAVIIIVYAVVCQVRNKERYPRGRAVVWILLFSYGLVLLQTALFSREPGSRNEISLTLFETWGYSVQMHAYFLENILMFIPFGILMPAMFKQMRKMRYCTLAGFLCSCGIEISQLITQRGYCQIDDVVTNTAGTLVGWLVWKGAFELYRLHD